MLLVNNNLGDRQTDRQNKSNFKKPGIHWVLTGAWFKRYIRTIDTTSMCNESQGLKLW